MTISESAPRFFSLSAFRLSIAGMQEKLDPAKFDRGKLLGRLFLQLCGLGLVVSLVSGCANQQQVSQQKISQAPPSPHQGWFALRWVEKVTDDGASAHVDAPEQVSFLKIASFEMGSVSKRRCPSCRRAM